MTQLEDTLREAERSPASFGTAEVRRRVAARARRRRQRRAGAAAAVFVLVAAFSVSRINSEGASTVTTAGPTRTDEPADSGTAPVDETLVDLSRIEASSSNVEGTTGVTLVFDNPLPDAPVVAMDTIRAPDHVGIAYTAQSSQADSSILVCGDTHWFPPPGNRTVDVLVPTGWLAPDAALHAGESWDPDTFAGGKIIVCPPRDGFVQVSIWGAASAQLDDVDVTVTDDRIEIAIAPSIVDSAVGGSEADVVEVTCDGRAITTSSSSLAAQADGVHLRVHNTTTEPLDFSIGSNSGSVEPGTTELVESNPPGTDVVECRPRGADAEIQRTTLRIDDPHGFYVAGDIDCLGGAVAATYPTTHRGTTAREAAENALAHFRHTDRVDKVGYRDQEGKWVARASDGRIIATATSFAADDGFEAQLSSFCVTAAPPDAGE